MGHKNTIADGATCPSVVVREPEYVYLSEERNIAAVRGNRDMRATATREIEKKEEKKEWKREEKKVEERTLLTLLTS